MNRRSLNTPRGVQPTRTPRTPHNPTPRRGHHERAPGAWIPTAYRAPAPRHPMLDERDERE